MPVSMKFTREKGMTIRVDGMVKAKTAALQKILIKNPGGGQSKNYF